MDDPKKTMLAGNTEYELQDKEELSLPKYQKNRK